MSVTRSLSKALTQSVLTPKIEKLRKEYNETVTKWKTLSSEASDQLSEASLAYREQLKARFTQLSTTIREMAHASQQPDEQEKPAMLLLQARLVTPVSSPSRNDNVDADPYRRRRLQNDSSQDDDGADPYANFSRREHWGNDYRQDDDGKIPQADPYRRMELLNNPKEDEEFVDSYQLPMGVAKEKPGLMSAILDATVRIWDDATARVLPLRGPVVAYMDQAYEEEGNYLITIIEQLLPAVVVSSNYGHLSRNVYSVLPTLIPAIRQSKQILNYESEEPLSFKEIQETQPLLKALETIFDNLSTHTIKEIKTRVGEFTFLKRPIIYRLDKYIEKHYLIPLLQFFNERGFTPKKLEEATHYLGLISPLNRDTIAYNILNIFMPVQPKSTQIDNLKMYGLSSEAVRNPSFLNTIQGLYPKAVQNFSLLNTRFPLDPRDIERFTSIISFIKNQDQKNYFLMHLITYLMIVQLRGNKKIDNAISAIIGQLDDTYCIFIHNQLMSEDPVVPTEEMLKLPSIRVICQIIYEHQHPMQKPWQPAEDERKFN